MWAAMTLARLYRYTGSSESLLPDNVIHTKILYWLKLGFLVIPTILKFCLNFCFHGMYIISDILYNRMMQSARWEILEYNTRNWNKKGRELRTDLLSFRNLCVKWRKVGFDILCCYLPWVLDYLTFCPMGNISCFFCCLLNFLVETVTENC